MKSLYLMLVLILCNVFGKDEGDLWIQFKVDFKKRYNTPEEELLRFQIFKDNLKEINDHNTNYHLGLATYEMAINKFTDLTIDEYRTEYKMYPSTDTFLYNDSLPEYNEIRNYENYVDWREKGAVTPAKNQGTCGACWIFSTVAVLEGFYFKKFNKLVHFSQQHIVDCIANTTCKGGWPLNVFEYVKKHGIIKEEDYPYVGKQQECRDNISKHIHVPFNKIVHIEKSEAKLKEAVQNFGPVLVCLYSSYKWRFYKRGVWYERECSLYSNHAVALVGYGRENGLDYWLIKNSMGEDWGENGYIKIVRNRHNNYCGITDYAFYLT